MTIHLEFDLAQWLPWLIAAYALVGLALAVPVVRRMAHDCDMEDSVEGRLVAVLFWLLTAIIAVPIGLLLLVTYPFSWLLFAGRKREG